MDAFGILPDFAGVAVHDAFSPYFGYTGCEHALCNAHLLRDLIFVKGQSIQPWAAGMLHLLGEMKDAVDAAKDQGQDTCRSRAAMPSACATTASSARAGGATCPPSPQAGRAGQSRPPPTIC